MIEIFNLKKVYKNRTLALDSISLSIETGDFFALLGKNGAGKSTAIGILTSLIKKDSGKIFVNNYDLDRDCMYVRSLIGFVPQEYNFNQFESVLDIVINQAGFYGVKKSIAIDRAVFFLKFFDLWNDRYTISMNLSGGMKRRLMIVRALIHNPDILILDEPTAGVDIFTRRLIWKFLKEFNASGKTVILTTHYLEEVEYLCKSVAIIDFGSLLLKTKVSMLLEKFSKRNIFLFVDNVDFVCSLVSEFFSFLKYGLDVVEVVFLKEYNITLLFDFFIKNGVFVRDIKADGNRLEDLFIKLLT